MADIINAVKRLERAGAENSRATQKLRDAAVAVSGLVIAQVPRGVELPRGYVVRAMHSNISTAEFLYQPVWAEGGMDEVAVDVTAGGYLHGDFNCPLRQTPRQVLVDFAADVANGWLDEVATWMEKRAAEAEQAAVTLAAKVV